jgi:hypothetical protein
MGDICGGIRRIIRYATGKCFDGAGGYHAADPVKICDFDGQGAPKLTKEHIAFNGEAPELDHESFYFEAKRSLPYPGAQALRCRRGGLPDFPLPRLWVRGIE